jgi:hypothetical protein
VSDNSPFAWDGVHIETLKSPDLYSQPQIDLACAVTSLINRGKFILCVPPAFLTEEASG